MQARQDRLTKNSVRTAIQNPDKKNKNSAISTQMRSFKSSMLEPNSKFYEYTEI